ncbi:MAG: exo-alpha-sialidase [Bacteroidota bacterium]
MNTHVLKVFLLTSILSINLLNGQTQDHQTKLFVSGENGYNSYRIPSIITTQKGTLLAFCEGRKEPGDAGDIDLLMRRSTDNGLTWGNPITIWDDKSNTCGNPCPVVDEETGVVWLLLTHNIGTDKESDIITKKSEGTRTVWVASSDDDGLSWSKPKEITKTTKDPSWGWYATGPGVGIQIKEGPRKGRLVIPCDHSYDDPNGNVRNGPYEYGSHSIYSDDHGKTWQLGGTIRPKVNECQVVEVADGNGTLLMNMRSYFGNFRRTHSTSYDGGITWTKPVDVDELVEPVCQASLLRYQWHEDEEKSVILFLNPASAQRIRHNLSLRASFDEGKTWPRIKTIHAGPSAYSSMSKTRDGKVALFYEAGVENPYESLICEILDPKKVSITK